MPPKFSLQPVLDFRETREEILEVELGQLLHAQRSAKTFLEALQNSLSRILYQLSRYQTDDVDIFMIGQLHSNLDIVNERITLQEARLKELSNQIEQKRQELVNAKQASEVLEKLKSHEIERFEDEQSRIENRMLDDIYIARAFQRSQSVA
jgi:flagellar export protein FliJ